MAFRGEELAAVGLLGMAVLGGVAMIAASQPSANDRDRELLRRGARMRVPSRMGGAPPNAPCQRLANYERGKGSDDADDYDLLAQSDDGQVQDQCQILLVENSFSDSEGSGQSAGEYRRDMIKRGKSQASSKGGGRRYGPRVASRRKIDAALRRVLADAAKRKRRAGKSSRVVTSRSSSGPDLRRRSTVEISRPKPKPKQRMWNDRIYNARHRPMVARSSTIRSSGGARRV